MQPVEPSHDREVGGRHWTRQIIDTATADLQNFRLFRDRQVVLTVDHRFALSRPALLSAPSKKLGGRCAPPVGYKRVIARLRPEGSGRYDFGGT